MNIQDVRMFLKKNFEGPEVLNALRFRLQTHLTDPTSDPLSAQVWDAYQKLPFVLSEPFSVLDAGCMSGFLYHHLRRYFRNFEYTGVDKWPAALEIAKEAAPDVRFLKSDFINAEVDGVYDYIICSNIPFKGGEKDAALAKFKPHARRYVVMIHPGSILELHEGNAASRVT